MPRRSRRDDAYLKIPTQDRVRPTVFLCVRVVVQSSSRCERLVLNVSHDPIDQSRPRTYPPPMHRRASDATDRDRNPRDRDLDLDVERVGVVGVGVVGVVTRRLSRRR